MPHPDPTTPAAGNRCTGAALSAFYFLFYGAVGVYVMFFAPYLRGLGFSGADISLVTVLGPFVGIAGTLAWATVADRWDATTRTLRWCALASCVPLLVLPFARTPPQVAAVNLVHQVSAGACVPLIDSLTFEWLKTRPGNYTRIRMFGALGGLLVVQAVGLLLTARGQRPGDAAMPVSLAVVVGLLVVVAWFLPEAPPRDRPPNLRDWGTLLRNRTLQLFLLVCLLHWLSFAPYDLLFGVFLHDIGLPPSLLALVLVGGSLAEAAMMWAFPRLEARFEVRPLLAAAIVVMGLRWWGLAHVHGLAPIALLQVVHGAAAAMFWGTMVQAVGHIVPARLRVTGHGLFAAVVVGGGNTLGYWLAGLGYDHFGGATRLFRLAALLELVPLVLLLAVGGRFNADPSARRERGVRQ